MMYFSFVTTNGIGEVKQSGEPDVGWPSQQRRRAYELLPFLLLSQSCRSMSTVTKSAWAVRIGSSVSSVPYVEELLWVQMTAKETT